MKYDYQESSRYFAVMAGGLEQDAAEELAELGATGVEPHRRGVSFHAELRVLYRICYASRLIGRVLAPLVSFRAPDADALYARGREVRWDDLLDTSDTFSVSANVSGSQFTHSQFAALRLKDAIADSFRDRTGKRPNVDREDPDVRIALHIAEDRGTIFVEATSGSLHKRGYRQRGVEAPMQETLAAAIVRFSGWDGERPLYDPFCGSGTLLAEAVMRHARIPAAFLRRRHGFERFPDFAPEVWRAEKAALDGQIRELPRGTVMGSDIDPAAVDASRGNLRKLPGAERVQLRRSDFRELASLEGMTIVTNPPYGLRMEIAEGVEQLYRDLGDFLKRRAAGSTAFIYVGEPRLVKLIGLRPSARKPLVNGALDGRCCRFELFAQGWRER